MPKTEFNFYISMAQSHQRELKNIYISIISIIDHIRKRSITQMNQISDLEEGLGLSHERDNKQNIDFLTRDIKVFNNKINTVVDKFNFEYDHTSNSYHKAFDVFEPNENSDSILVQAKKELILLDRLLRRLREKIVSLQQMNNVLYSFSEDLKLVKDDYAHNLSRANSSISSALDSTYKVIEKIQLLKIEA